MKNDELEKYRNKQLNSETPYELKSYQVFMVVIITILAILFIFLPLLISEEYGFNFGFDTNIYAVVLFIIFILFPPILLIFLGNFLQKLIHRIIKTKYHIHMFPLFIILICSALFIATISIVIKDFCNHVHDPKAPKMVLIATGFLSCALSLSGKVVTKYDNENESQEMNNEE